MAHGQHTTRRALFKGAAATILAGTVAGTAIARQPDMLRFRAEQLIADAREVRIALVLNPHTGGIWVAEPADDPHTEEEAAVWHRLKRRLREDPVLKAEVKAVLAAS